MNEQQKYQKRNLLLFPLGTVGRDAVYALINSFLLTFALFTLLVKRRTADRDHRNYGRCPDF